MELASTGVGVGNPDVSVRVGLVQATKNKKVTMLR